MAYELIMVYYGLSSSYAIFYCHFSVFSSKNYPTGHGAPEEVRRPLLIFSLKSYHAAFTALFLTLSIISMALAVCIPKKIQRISVFLFRAFILESE